MRISYVGPGKYRAGKFHVKDGSLQFYVEANRDKDVREQVRSFLDAEGKYKQRILPGQNFVHNASDEEKAALAPVSPAEAAKKAAEKAKDAADAAAKEAERVAAKVGNVGAGGSSGEDEGR